MTKFKESTRRVIICLRTSNGTEEVVATIPRRGSLWDACNAHLTEEQQSRAYGILSADRTTWLD